MKVSFVIPVLNSEATLGECLDAIHAQKVPDGVSFEIVIADAGSSDRSARPPASRPRTAT